MQIRIFKDTETVRYAAEELAKYLGIMDNTIGTEIVVSQEISKDAITLGILADLGREDSTTLSTLRLKIFRESSQEATSEAYLWAFTSF